mgnify:CR=1 FL=1
MKKEGKGGGRKVGKKELGGKEGWRIILLGSKI